MQCVRRYNTVVMGPCAGVCAAGPSHTRLGSRTGFRWVR